MSMFNSAGVYPRIKDQSFLVSSSGLLTGAVVISSKRGPTEPTYVTSGTQFLSLYGTPSRVNPSMYAAIRFLNRAGSLTVVRATLDAVAASGTLQTSNEAETLLSFTAENGGAWGNKLTVEFAEIVGAKEGVFQLIVKEDGLTVETFEVSLDEDAKNGYGANVYIEDVVNEGSTRIRVEDNSADVSEGMDLTATVTFAGGSDDTGAPDEATIIAGYNAFQRLETEAQLLINAGWATPAVQTAMLNTAEIRKDAVAILDVPQDAAGDAQAMVDYRDELGANTYFGGLYGGWIKAYDQYNDRNIEVPASGDVAATFVNTVEVGERWDAPAGLQRGVITNALGTTLNMSEGERDLLYVNGINPVTSINGTAAVVWGQKTLQKEQSALDRFNVVNLLLWANQRMSESLQPFVFEPNTQFTRDNVNSLLTSFLSNIQQRGGLYDFSVNTGTDINTSQIIDSNAMLVTVLIQPTRVAEYLQLTLTVTRTGVSLS